MDVGKRIEGREGCEGREPEYREYDQYPGVTIIDTSDSNQKEEVVECYREGGDPGYDVGHRLTWRDWHCLRNNAINMISSSPMRMSESH